MKLVIFGLAVSSSWGNGHATLWRGLLQALIKRGHTVVFFERDVPYYASTRDLPELPGGELILYPAWKQVTGTVRGHLNDADVAMVTSYCPDGIAATEMVLDSRTPLKTFYDLDTGVTLSRLRQGESLGYIGPRGLADFDLVLSYTGGEALNSLRTVLGARRVAPLYGSVDPDLHHPVAPEEHLRADLSYLGTYAQDRQTVLNDLLIETAYRRPAQRFLIGGSQYPADFPWSHNIHFVWHVSPSEHSAFYCSSRLTLNVTRAPMAEMGYCPSARLFEAAACGTPILSDGWAGLDLFFEPGSEILVAKTTEDALDALDNSSEQLEKIARGARERTLTEHTAQRRAIELETLLQQVLAGSESGMDPAENSAGPSSIYLDHSMHSA